MRFASLASVLVSLYSGNAFSAFDDLESSFLDNASRRDMFKYQELTPDGVMKGTYTPHVPAPAWKRAMVFAPSIRMVRIPLIVGTIPACFLIEKYFRYAS